MINSFGRQLQPVKRLLSLLTAPDITRLERVAAASLAFLLLASGVFAIFAARATSGGLFELRRASLLNHEYQRARYAVGAEESLERKYRLEPGQAIREEHRKTGEELESALSAAQLLVNPHAAAELATLRRLHQRYSVATTAMFDAVDRRRPDLAIKLDHDGIDPVFDIIQHRVLKNAAAGDLAMVSTVRRIDAVQEAVITISAAFALASVLCFFVYFNVMRSYKRQLSQSHKVELETLAEAAMVDHLTGVGNHRAYKEEFERETSRALRHGESLALALLDVDEMKLINDQNGHMQGDEVLIALGGLLRQLRVEDRAFRIGGDEFAVLLPSTNLADAAGLMERLRKSTEIALLGSSVSIGVAALSGGNCDAETLQGQADAALYAAKRAGRNAVRAFDANVDEMWLLSPTKVRQLRNLIVDEAVSIVFQPIWDVDRCAILAYEALARPDPDYGFAGPQDAFDLAERVGRAHEIDAVCRRATLSRAHHLPADSLLFINMTPQSLDNGHLDPSDFAAEVAAAGLTPERVVIEITERSIAQVDVVIRVAKELQRFGFRLALDDTGAGNAGLEMLSRLPVEFVKIDRAIIVTAMDDLSSRGVMAGIIAIAKATGAYVIAEGIEDINMLELVCGTGRAATENQRSVQGVQGYLLLRPSETMATPSDSAQVKALLREVASPSKLQQTDRPPAIMSASS